MSTDTKNKSIQNLVTEIEDTSAKIASAIDGVSKTAVASVTVGLIGAVLSDLQDSPEVADVFRKQVMLKLGVEMSGDVEPTAAPTEH